MKRRFEAVASPTPLYRTDPAYPGVPLAEPGEVAARTTSRATVDYDTFVLRYAARQRGHVLLATAGVILILGAGIYLPDGPAIIVLIALGIGAIMAGGVGFFIAAGAHDTYTQHLAVSVSETYHTRPAAPPATVRPFVVSANGDGRTTNTGRLDFTPQVWQALFDRALANGGFINRDDVAKRVLPRRWYYGEGYGQLLEELTRLKFIDARNRLTPAALAWYEQQIPLPLAALPTRPRNGRTDERTDGADGAEWGEQ